MARSVTCMIEKSAAAKGVELDIDESKRFLSQFPFEPQEKSDTSQDMYIGSNDRTENHAQP